MNSFSKHIDILHKRLAAERHLAGGQFQQVAENGEEFLKLRETTRTAVISRTGGNTLNLSKQKYKIVLQRKFLVDMILVRRN
jgi:hypothetical protein